MINKWNAKILSPHFYTLLFNYFKVFGSRSETRREWERETRVWGGAQWDEIEWTPDGPASGEISDGYEIDPNLKKSKI